MSTHDDASMVADEVQADGTAGFWPSDANIRQGNEEYYEEEMFQRMTRLGGSEEMFDLWYAFEKTPFAPRVSGVTVPTLRGEQSLFEAFSEIVKCTMHFGVHPLYPLDDTGIAKLFAASFRDKLCYVPERRQWFQYASGRWCPGDAEAMECCKDLTLTLQQYATTDQVYGRSDIGRRVASLANRWLTRRGRETILRDAASVRPVSMSKFDVHPNLLNCLNYTYDLDTGAFREHRPGDYLTKMANVRYVPGARCDLWEEHIRTVMRGDESLAAYLQESLGYALSGYTDHECFFILFGRSSRNGKGVTMSTFKALLGDYALAASPDTITRKQTANGGGPSEDIARLAGARCVSIAEPDEGMILSSALIKTLTGGDTVPARFLHQQTFEYVPSYKIFVHTNYLPEVTDPTVFKSGRVRVIPFTLHLPPDKRNRQLKVELAEPENLSGILNWCLAGWQRLRDEGTFVACEAVEAITREYELASGVVADDSGGAGTVDADSDGPKDVNGPGNMDGSDESIDRDPDTAGRFVREALDERPGGEVPVRTAYEAYCGWCKGYGLEAEPFRLFRNELLLRNCVVKKKRPTDKSLGPNACSMLLGYVLREKNCSDS